MWDVRSDGFVSLASAKIYGVLPIGRIELMELDLDVVVRSLGVDCFELG